MFIPTIVPAPVSVPAQTYKIDPPPKVKPVEAIYNSTTDTLGRNINLFA